jgi:hypothetical protein
LKTGVFFYKDWLLHEIKEYLKKNINQNIYIVTDRI